MTGSQSPARAGRGRRFGARNGGGKGPGGPGAHHEVADVLSLSGEGRLAGDFCGGGARVRRGNGDGGGDSRRPGLIPLARSKRTARRTFSARRWGWGRHGMAALCVSSDYCEFSWDRGRGRWGRKEEQPGREEKDEGEAWHR
jgi:hypothetical protein